LKLALEAGLPLVSVTTTDVMNASDVLAHVSGREVIEWDGKTLTDDALHWTDHHLPQAPWCMLYERLVEVDATLVFINPDFDEPLFRDCGELHVPSGLVREFLLDVCDEDAADALLPLFGGLTLHEVAETVRIAHTTDGTLSPRSVARTREALWRPSRGVSLVDTSSVATYLPPDELLTYCDDEREFFLGDHDTRLVPRGLLFDGPSGTGKTEGAKYLAARWGVPLFRIDATVQSKWQGESEWFLSRALSQVEAAAPCVLLIDEAEKMYAGDNEVVSRMLGELLWWMQSRRARVMTVLTTNAVEKLPAELYRPGRVDRTMSFEGLGDHASLVEFMRHVFKTFKKASKKAGAGAMIIEAYQQYPVAQADAVAMVHHAVKGVIMAKHNPKTKDKEVDDE